MATKHHSIDEYIATFPDDVQKVLQEIRTVIRNAAPEAAETISYDMPTFNLNGTYLIYFAGWKKHVALYPVTGKISEALATELSGYKGTKGSVHFPLNKPMPLDLIRKITELRIAENQANAAKQGAD
ncbi:iron chaperone [Dyadobacter sp. BHUBP1]|uniref:iron chaperone n=1 Tax=Dyadobacter sp. BHUBP1 TaxID=3424178 RepID=UPI003D344D46